MSAPLPEPSFIAIDWGTSRARVWRCDERGRVVSEDAAPGIASFAARPDLERAFDAIVQKASPPGQALPVVMCGMVGSSIGLLETKPLDAPVDLDALPSRAARFSEGGRNAHIVPGLRAVNAFGAPDVMRGEETQLLGLAAATDETFGLVCLPGTHCKWVAVEGRVVRSFFTALTGELFAALSSRSILLRDVADTRVQAGEGFDKAVSLVRDNPGVGVDALLFSTRSRRLSGELAENQLASYLSGLLIAADVANALRTMPEGRASVAVVGDDQLVRLYGAALAAFGVKAAPFSGARMSLGGLQRVAAVNGLM